MRDTGIVRKIDELGRIVLPIELRREMEIEEKDTLSILIDGEHIVLKKHSPSCFICGEEYGLVEFEGKKICKNCVHGIGVLDTELY